MWFGKIIPFYLSRSKLVAIDLIFVPDMTDPTLFYQQRSEQFSREMDALKSRYDKLSYVRLLAFVAGIALIIFLLNEAWYLGLAATVLFLPLFVYFVKWHQRMAERVTHYGNLANLARAELAALDHQYGNWPDGKRFSDQLHPYTSDLDIFGPHSLFQFLNRCVTAGGENQLATYLRSAAPTGDIQLRQKAITELSEQPAWCHEFRARGAGLNDDPVYQQQLLNWLKLPVLVSNSPLLKAARWFVPVLFVITIYLLFTLSVWQLGLLGLLPVALIMRKYNEEISRQHAYTGKVSDALGHYANLLTWIESAEWSTTLLTQRQSPLQQGKGAAKALEQLRYASGQLDVRYNAFSALLELSGLWSLQWLYRLEKWKMTYATELPGWFASLAEIDALVSMSNLRFNRQNWPFATVSEERCFYGVSIGHPLLNPKDRVNNEVNMSTDGHIHLVTGSNMAGKSTWLRTVGVNIVLALAGAPVCAKELRLPQLQVWTSMRTQDALHESTSSFFAELKRLKAIIEAVEAPQRNVFFLLDEILKGTNSRDRHTGARALIRQLIQSRGAGIIATHDLELAEMEKEAGSQVENYAMEVQIENGKLVFDYKLHRGVSQSFNATVLMAEMGIRIAEEDIRVFRNEG